MSRVQQCLALQDDGPGVIEGHHQTAQSIIKGLQKEMSNNLDNCHTIGNNTMDYVSHQRKCRNPPRLIPSVDKATRAKIEMKYVVQEVCLAGGVDRTARIPLHSSGKQCTQCSR